MNSIEVPVSFLRRGPEILERAGKTGLRRSVRLKRPLSKDEFNDGDPTSLKKVRFATGDHGSEEYVGKDIGKETEDGQDTHTRVPSRRGASGRTSSAKVIRETDKLRYPIKEPKRGKKVVEIEPGEQAAPEPDVDELERQRRVVTSTRDPRRQKTRGKAIATGDNLGFDSFLNASPKPEAMSEHFDALHDLIRNFISNWYDFDEIVHFSRRSRTDERSLEILRRESSPEQIYYITCHASPGPSGVDGWEQLFRNKDSREAVMYGVIAKALEEHVFGELLFGANKNQTKHLEQQEVNFAERDGFERTEIRAEYIEKALKSRNRKDALQYPPKYWSQVEHVALRLFALIYPILLLNPKTVGLETLVDQAEYELSSTDEQYHVERENKRKELLKDLHLVVESAAMTSLLVRLCKDTTFSFQPVFKNTCFDPDAMQSWDPDFIWNGDPQNKENDLGDAYRTAHWNDEPIVQVVCSSAIVMYKKGGPPEVKTAGEKGLRVKSLRKALVNLRWGKPRPIPPQKDDGYLELGQALEQAHEKYIERDALYTEMEQEKAEYQRLSDEERARPDQEEEEAKQKPRARSCVVM